MPIHPDHIAAAQAHIYSLIEREKRQNSYPLTSRFTKGYIAGLERAMLEYSYFLRTIPDPTPTPEPEPTFQIGDRVRVLPGARSACDEWSEEFAKEGETGVIVSAIPDEDGDIEFLPDGSESEWDGVFLLPEYLERIQ